MQVTVMPKVRRCRVYGCHGICTRDHYYCDVHRDQEPAYLAQRAQWAKRDKVQQHHYNTATRNRTQSKAEQYAYYRSRAWSQLRQQALTRDHYLCQYCRAQGIITPGKIGDHVVPIEVDPSGMDVLSNVVCCCAACHRLKTKWEQGYYGTGQHGGRQDSSHLSTNQVNHTQQTNHVQLTDVTAIAMMMQSKSGTN